MLILDTVLSRLQNGTALNINFWQCNIDFSFVCLGPGQELVKLA